MIVENFSPQETEGGINSMLTTGAYVSFSFISQRSTMVITLVGNGGFPDNNPIMDGFTLAKQSSAGMLDSYVHTLTVAPSPCPPMRPCKDVTTAAAPKLILVQFCRARGVLTMRRPVLRP